ncbi:DUF6270 domain-containing protein [Terrabacter sp. MAHUQ-38]|uniref:DUF6270 domain-containing protein n=1 Tax=unclassified Terrabacter TaxID=2630222 RepID=UPI00165D6DEE|nr:DUF6270 domain-containing protein [Terrabacter sp. MAHUQ-38]MBC9821929.1 hypothetical protein [Terrabacter sp. MAHUQ-38]
MTDTPLDDERDETRTLIYGSCVSRDTFEFLPDTYRLVTYVARQSAISAGAPADGVLTRLKQLPSAFQNRMVGGDVRGDLPAVLERNAQDVDLVLIDLIDERGGVVPIGGGFVTKLAELWSAGGREVTAGIPLLEFGTNEHFDAWSGSFEAVVGHLNRLGLKKRTVVLRTPWAKLAPDGSPIPIPSWMTAPDTANRLYQRYFEHVERLGLTVIDLPEDLARSPLDHRWGPSPFHYMEPAYRHLADGIAAFAAAPQRAEPLQTEAISPAAEPVSVNAFTEVGRRDPSTWGEAQIFGSVRDLAGARPRNGLVTLITEAAPVDLLVEDNQASTTVVSLHASMGQKPMDLPIFTGRSVTEGLPVNRIFVSDASLCLDPELKLGWYLGGTGLDLTRLLHDAISAIQVGFGARHLVFFGMSGGGFASLNLSHTFPGSLAVPVNAQTRIADYHPPAWQAFAAACLGAVGAEAALAALDAHPRADLRRVYAGGFDNSVIYLQNSQDAHVTTQLRPWLQALPTHDGVHLLLREWGRGHVPPTARELRSLMQDVAPVDGDWAALARRWGAVPATEVG